MYVPAHDDTGTTTTGGVGGGVPATRPVTLAGGDVSGNTPNDITSD